jgi:hypothetical protein
LWTTFALSPRLIVALSIAKPSLYSEIVYGCKLRIFADDGSVDEGHGSYGQTDTSAIQIERYR